MDDAAVEDGWVGFDLGGTKMLAVAFDGRLAPLGRARKKSKGHEGAETGLARIADLIREALTEAKLDPTRLRGIGVGCPGPLDLAKGVILDAPNLGWTNVRIKDFLGEQFGCPVVILNDVDAGTYGEYRFGAGQGARCLVGIFPGTGIGGGAVLEGKLIQGRNRSCMEIGHLQVVADGPLCGCGRRGCLEAVASRLAIAGAAAQAAVRGEAPHLRLEAGVDLDRIRSSTLARSIKSGDVAVERIVRIAAGHLGVAAANLVNLLAPETIVLGGGLVEAMPELIVEEVARTAHERVMPSFQKSFRVIAAQLGDDATALGSAAWAARVLGEVPATVG